MKIQRESEKAFDRRNDANRAGESKPVHRVQPRTQVAVTIARNDINIAVNGEQCETMLDGLYLPANDQLVDQWRPCLSTAQEPG